MAWVAACQPDPVAVYAQVLSDDGQLDPAACDPVTDPALRSDCLLVVATRRLMGVGEPAEAACAEVPAGTWRAECLFVAAEQAAADKRDGRAAALCKQAGPFAEDCAQHLWQDALYRVARRPQQPLPDMVRAATPLHDTWAGYLRWTGDFHTRFWRLAFELAFTGSRIDPARCDAVDPALQGACVAGAVGLVERELAPALARGGLSLCTLEPRITALGPALPAAPDPRLDAVVAARQAELCE